MDTRTHAPAGAADGPDDGGAAPAKVWDLPTRLFHWGLVLAVAGAAGTGYLAPDSWLDIHVWFGTAILALLAFRVTWGFVGSRYSRFRSFAFPPAETRRFLRDLVRGRPGHYPGHNPAGALMIFALLGVLGLLVATGFAVLGAAERQGPLAAVVPYAFGEAFEEVHEVLAGVLLALIGGHLLGVVVESLLARDNLVRAMVTGRKRVRGALARGAVHPVLSGLGILLLAASIVLVAWGVRAVGATAPGVAVPPPTTGTLYQSECGECHHAFHPSLLPASSWEAVLDGLDDHFGEVATLPGATVAQLATYLDANAAGHWDTKPANLFRALDPARPQQITATPGWRYAHHELPESAFADPKVGGRANCGACHGDAARGLYADRNIHIPGS